MIGIIDYGMGNLRSLRNALDYLGLEAEVVTEARRIAEMSHLILPGVGAFGKAMENVRTAGFVAAIREHVGSKKPLLGICLGMQMLATRSEEFGEHEGLGLVPGRVVPFEPSVEFPVPHVGWNTFSVTKSHPFFRRTKKAVDFYFVHSFHFETDEAGDALAVTKYGRSFNAVVARGSVIGCQFHPEKSQAGGLSLLEDFSEWNGSC